MRVKARDIHISVYVRVSDNIVNPYPKQFFRENIAQVTTYDDLTVSVSLPEAQMDAPAIAGAITPHRHNSIPNTGPIIASAISGVSRRPRELTK